MLGMHFVIFQLKYNFCKLLDNTGKQLIFVPEQSNIFKPLGSGGNEAKDESNPQPRVSKLLGKDGNCFKNLFLVTFKCSSVFGNEGRLSNKLTPQSRCFKPIGKGGKLPNKLL